MKLLVVTQSLDTHDPVLGFFHKWVEALALKTERVSVIALRVGAHNLPANVSAYSLGKEKGRAHPAVYALRFLALAWKLRREYDAVLVHMNQEYVLIAGLFWKLFGKRIYMWRNHYAGSFVTDWAAFFCDKVFCTSRASYTARYKKTELMPVGVDLERFVYDSSVTRPARSVLFLARIAPSKRPEMFIEALEKLSSAGVRYTADIYGSPAEGDEAFYESLKTRASALGDSVSFRSGVPNADTPALYASHELFVNCSPSGMFDKTIFEAAACGAEVIAASDDFAALAGADRAFGTSEELAARLTHALQHPRPGSLTSLAREHGLSALAERLTASMQS